MKYLLEKLKLASVGFLALSFLTAVTVSSCGTASNETEEEETEVVDEAAESGDEHPAAVYPSGGAEHPADTTSEGGEHPTDTTTTEAQ